MIIPSPKYKLTFSLILIGVLLISHPLWAQNKLLNQCDNNPYRSWWDVTSYDLHIDFTDTLTGTIRGFNRISARVVGVPGQAMQIDLDSPLTIDTILFKGKRINPQRNGLTVANFSQLHDGDTFSVKVFFHGRPIDAKNPPWLGGFIRKRDSLGKLWWAVACEGKGAALWFPCKNFRGDEPDKVTMTYTVPRHLMAIGNGRLVDSTVVNNGHAQRFVWEVNNPINNYDITFYIGDYIHWSDTFHGLNGLLDLDYYVLRRHERKAKKQFAEVKTMLSCFENHFGPYPFYKDGYKLVEAPYLGMEHQSAIAYGNHFKMGYLGEDRSKTGVGLLFDFIIIHESAHEWFGNSITAYDEADSWIHEGFASYAETVFAECIAGRKKAFEYQRGKRRTIQNDIPIEGKFNQCDEGSSDAYDKAGFMLHQIRILMKSDSAFFNMIKAMNATYRHQIVTGKEIENFIIRYSGLQLSAYFNQYLRTANLPTLAFWQGTEGKIWYQWKNCVPGFEMSVIYKDKGKEYWLYPQTEPKVLKDKNLKSAEKMSKDFLIDIDWQLGKNKEN